MAPAYLTEPCVPLSQNRSNYRLQSSYCHKLTVLSVKLSVGFRSSSVSNALIDYLRDPSVSIELFKRYLKNLPVCSILTQHSSALETFMCLDWWNKKDAKTSSVTVTCLHQTHTVIYRAVHVISMESTEQCIVGMFKCIITWQAKRWYSILAASLDALRCVWCVLQTTSQTPGLETVTQDTAEHISLSKRNQSFARL